MKAGNLNLIINRILGHLSINIFFRFFFERGTKEGNFFSEKNAFFVKNYQQRPESTHFLFDTIHIPKGRGVPC